MREEKTLPVQNMHLGEAEMTVLNGPIFGLHLRNIFRLCSGLNIIWAAHKPLATVSSSFVVPFLGHDGYVGISFFLSPER